MMEVLVTTGKRGKELIKDVTSITLKHEKKSIGMRIVSDGGEIGYTYCHMTEIKLTIRSS